MREDVKLRPEWEKHLEVGSSKCPFSLMKSYAKELAQGLLDGSFSPI
jgi:hypothetical protein